MSYKIIHKDRAIQFNFPFLVLCGLAIKFLSVHDAYQFKGLIGIFVFISCKEILSLNLVPLECGIKQRTFFFFFLP